MTEPVKTVNLRVNRVFRSLSYIYNRDSEEVWGKPTSGIQAHAFASDIGLHAHNEKVWMQFNGADTSSLSSKSESNRVVVSTGGLSIEDAVLFRNELNRVIAEARKQVRQAAKSVKGE